MRRHLLAILLLITVAFSVGCTNVPPVAKAAKPSSSQQAERKIAMISLTSDPGVESQEVNMALIFAGFCVDEGYDVSMFLNVNGVKLASKEFSAEAKFGDHTPLKKQLVALSERGVQIHVCPICMKDLAIEKADIIPEAFVTDKPKLFAKLGSDTLVFTY